MRLSDLLLTHVPLSWDEALALVRALVALDLPEEPEGDIAATVNDVALGPDGHLVVLAGSTPAVSTSGLAMLLRHALPEPGRGSGQPAPGALRYTVSRALKEVDAPPIVTVKQLAEKLARFEHRDPAEALAGVYERWTAMGRPKPLPAEHAPGEAAAADLPLRMDARVDPLPGTEPVEEGGPVRPRVESPGREHLGDGGRHRSWGRWAARAAAVLLLLGAGAAVGYLAYTEWPRLEATAASLAEGASARLEALRARRPPAGNGDTEPAKPSGAERPAEGVELAARGPDRSRTGDATAGPEAPAAPRSEPARPGLPEAAAPAGSPAGLPAEAGTTGEPGTGGPVSAADEEAVNRDGRMVQDLDDQRRPVFSASFAYQGSAVFMEDGAAGDNRGSPDGEKLHVVSLLEDGSRSYHPRLSPDGRLVAFDSDRDGVRGVYVSARDGTNVRRVSGSGYAAMPSWSPDGARLAFVRAEPSSAGVWNVWVLELASGDLRRVTSHASGQPWGASWFPDGRRICYSHDDLLVVFDTATGASQRYPSPRKGRLVRTPAVSPDGLHVIFQVHKDGAWLLDLLTGSMRRVIADPTAEEFSWARDGKRVAFHSRRDGQWAVWVFGGS